MRKMEWDVEQIKHWYCVEKLSSVVISEKTGWCKQAVLRFLYRHDISVRKRLPKPRRKITQGYIICKMPNHPRANCRGFVPEHILVWEYAHGKSLPKGWIIHHLNGIKDDNRLANLLAMPNRKHWKFIGELQGRIQQLEAQLGSQGQLC